MPASDGTPVENDQDAISLDEIIAAVKDCEGYIIFVGCVSPELDDRGNNVINFKYRRRNYSFEDAKMAVRELRRAVIDDIKSGMEVDDGTERP